MPDRPRKSGAISVSERADGPQATSTAERRGRAVDDRREGRGEATARRTQSNADLTDRRSRQHDKFGGISWGSTFFGWLSAAGLTAILAGLLGATGAALALNKVADKTNGSKAEPSASPAASACSSSSPSRTSAAATSRGGWPASTGHAKVSASGSGA